MRTLQPHVDRHAILSFEKQFHVYDVIGEADWWVNLDDGTITFGGELEMGAALLGTEASGTWLWGWANPGNFPEPVIAAGLAAAEYGREHDLPVLVDPESTLSDDVTLDRIGLVVEGVLPLAATYTGSLDEDARILLGLDHPSLALPPPDPARLVAVLTTCSSRASSRTGAWRSTPTRPSAGRRRWTASRSSSTTSAASRRSEVGWGELDRRAVRRARGGVVPGVAIARQRVGVGQRRSATSSSRAASQRCSTALRRARRSRRPAPPPTRPGEDAALLQRDRERERLRLPRLRKTARLGHAGSR